MASQHSSALRLFVLCSILACLVSGVSQCAAHPGGSLEKAKLKGFPTGKVPPGKGEGFKGVSHADHHGGRGPRDRQLFYNMTLLANLTDAANTSLIDGRIALTLFFNNKTGDYDLQYKVRVFQVPAGDNLTSALVLDSTGATLFNITNATTGFHAARLHATWTVTRGRFLNLTTLTTADGQSYLDAIQAMIAAPTTYTATVQSVNSPSGLASGAFDAKVLNGTCPGGRPGGNGRPEEHHGKNGHDDKGPRGFQGKKQGKGHGRGMREVYRQLSPLLRSV